MLNSLPRAPGSTYYYFCHTPHFFFKNKKALVPRVLLTVQHDVPRVYRPEGTLLFSAIVCQTRRRLNQSR